MGMIVQFGYKVRGIVVPAGRWLDEPNAPGITADELAVFISSERSQNNSERIVIALFLGYLNRNTPNYRLNGDQIQPRWLVLLCVQLSTFTVVITALSVLTLMLMSMVLDQILAHNIGVDVVDPSQLLQFTKYTKTVGRIRRFCTVVFVLTPFLYVFLYFILVVDPQGREGRRGSSMKSENGF
jgi:hypothetical protein